MTRHPRQRIAQPVRPARHTGKLKLGTEQIHRGRNNIETRHFRRDNGIFDQRRADQYIIGGNLALVAANAEAGAGIALRIEIDNQHALANGGKRGAEIDGGGRFSDAAFLVGNDEDAWTIRGRKKRPVRPGGHTGRGTGDRRRHVRSPGGVSAQYLVDLIHKDLAPSERNLPGPFGWEKVPT